VPVTLGMARRITYLVDKDGRIARVWPSVTPTGHANEILASVGSETEWLRSMTDRRSGAPDNGTVRRGR
jgi:hypothetical protein